MVAVTAPRPLRIRLNPRQGDTLDGGWWPYTRDFAAEFARLVDEFPSEHGRIYRGLYSRPDWDDHPRRVPVGRGRVKVGSFPADDTHVIHLTTSNRVVLCLLVVPADFSEEQGAESLLASTTVGTRHGAGAVLRAVSNEMPVDRSLLWEPSSDEPG
ncbi:hypothetical protein HNR19_002538 [Nocardioides thalensis]|uniref:Uncharacterized protein n=1 Tax=Nocardioides thalensis TaxID=1914755 RepID=A0A853C0T1_9ACTN|nr:DUF5994 family protein [Nocardioides thalensis]NYJ01840.1 hypothetical protein [Nocardioides thalensis]